MKSCRLIALSAGVCFCLLATRTLISSPLNRQSSQNLQKDSPQPVLTIKLSEELSLWYIDIPEMRPKCNDRVFGNFTYRGIVSTSKDKASVSLLENKWTIRDQEYTFNPTNQSLTGADGIELYCYLIYGRLLSRGKSTNETIEITGHHQIFSSVKIDNIMQLDQQTVVGAGAKFSDPLYNLEDFLRHY